MILASRESSHDPVKFVGMTINRIEQGPQNVQSCFLRDAKQTFLEQTLKCILNVVASAASRVGKIAIIRVPPGNQRFGDLDECRDGLRRGRCSEKDV
jgi:hypothetical protein